MPKRSAICVDGQAWRASPAELLLSMRVAARTHTGGDDAESRSVDQYSDGSWKHPLPAPFSVSITILAV
jgi:hypothetical protein